MNTELETWKQRQTKWIENGYKPEEEVIKVSELREWCLHRHFVGSRSVYEAEYSRGYCAAIKQILDQFCKGAK
jgi:hypothetical protein